MRRHDAIEKLLKATIVVGALLVGSSPAVPSRTTTTLQVQSGSTIRLYGSSNVRDWQCEGVTLRGTMEIAAPLQTIRRAIDEVESSKAATIDLSGAPRPELALAVPVTALRCGHRVMERDLQRATRASDFPMIEFRLTDADETARRVTATPRARYRAGAVGELALAGAKRKVKFDLTAQRVAAEKFRVSGETRLRMTDFGITPPSGLMGLVQARNELRVTFDLFLTPSPDNSPQVAR